MQVNCDNCNSQSKGAIHYVKTILRKEGPFGLFKGFSATAMREVPSLGVYFTTYSIMVDILESKYSNRSSTVSVENIEFRPSTPVVLLSGGLAGSMSWMIVYPIDVIKSNMQSPASDTHSSRLGLIATAKSLQQKYGWKIFTRGLGITVFRAFPVNASVFYFYELFRSHLQDHLPV